ncbi:hypothetical protein ACFV1L_20950 [Kitasatospora sp. NPDC059646]|uniref:hypothetical protein n=1 Tax=Kitasatospora sp. NPDC059646 TaxID=3346893 RepID=UPI003687DF86
MSWAISRDQQIAALYEKLHALSATIGGLDPGSAARNGLQAEADAVWAEIQRLKTARGISPRPVLIVLAITALAVWILLTPGH